MKTLKKKWIDFGGIILSPWFLVFIGITIFSLIYSILIKDNDALSNLLAVIGSITGGIAGGIFQSENEKQLGQNILEKKGRSALRNLESIEKQLLKIIQWIHEFKRGNKNKDEKMVLEEIERHLSTVQLNITSGLADWVDIVPELKEKIELLKKEEEYIRSIVDELIGKKKELLISEDIEKRKTLEQKINSLEDQLKYLRKTPKMHLIQQLGTNTPITLTARKNLVEPTFTVTGSQCISCEKNFASGDYGLVSRVGDGLYCPDCRKKQPK